MIEFIGARAIQGIGAGAVATLPFVLLGVVYPPNKRGQGVGRGRERVGGCECRRSTPWDAMRDHVSWRWAFLINVPIAIVAGFLAHRRNAREHRT